MAYNEQLADRMREHLAELPDVEEKAMMGGLVFMYKDKMLVGIIKDEMMCRVDPALVETLVEKTGYRQMDFTGRPMKSMVLIAEEGMRSKKGFDYWIGLALDYNPIAKASKKKSKK